MKDGNGDHLGVSQSPFKPGEYWENRLAGRIDLQGVGDIGLPLSYNACLYEIRERVFRRVTHSLQGRSSDWAVLDVGSGTGFYINAWLQLQPASITGLDITTTAVSRLSKRFPSAAFIQGDIGGPIPEGLAGRSFDVVTAYDVLFHIVDDSAYVRAFANTAQLLRPGGYLIFSDNLMTQRAIHGSHQVSRAESYVRAVLDERGFAIERIYPMFAFMNDPIRTRSRILKHLFGITVRLASRGEGWGRTVGRAWLPLESAATSILRRGPSTEVFVCRRIR